MKEIHEYKTDEIIKKIKEFYKLKRIELHIISGISEDALKRYERGEKMPHKYKLLLGSMLNLESFKIIYNLSKNRLSQSTIKKIDIVLKDQIGWRLQQLGEIRRKLMVIDNYII